MANNIRGNNSWFVTVSSSSGDTTSFLSDKSLKLIGIFFYSNATTDVIDIYDKNASSSAAGNKKISLMAGTAKDSRQIRLADAPIVFPNGVWVTLTGSPIATLIFTQGT